MLKIIKVAGNSLSPFVLPGDFVLIGAKPLFSHRIKPGDLIAFEHSQYGTLIKKVASYNSLEKTYTVYGTHLLSLDSDQIGPILSEQVLGKVLWHFKNPSAHSSI